MKVTGVFPDDGNWTSDGDVLTYTYPLIQGWHDRLPYPLTIYYSEIVEDATEE